MPWFCVVFVVVMVLGACRPAPIPQDPSRAIVLEVPLRGEWRVFRPPGHAAFAFDLAATGDGGRRLLRAPRWRHLLGRATVEDSYSWGRSVYAPASGVIVAAHDGWPDRLRLSLFRDAASMLLSRPELTPEDIRPFAGNHLILRTDSVHIFLAHLRSGSIRVSAGEVVWLGQPLAEVGNSGISLFPHLHLEVFDQATNLLEARTLAFHLRAFERWDGRTWLPQRNAPLHRGEWIRPLLGPSAAIGPASTSRATRNVLR
jgi:hypothetical protein